MSAGLSLAGLSVGYGRVTVLGGVDVAGVAPGTVVGLLGANGAGKSTLLRALAGLLPGRGRAVLDGVDLMAASAAHRLRHVAYLPQSLPQATPLLAYEAVLGALRATRPDLSTAATERIIEEVFATLGLGGLALRRLAQLSGGQRQMVGLAQVLARRPGLLLLDEPTSALDLRWQISVLECVRRLAAEQGTIALIAIHDINLATRFCQRLVVLGGGGVLADGPTADTLTPQVLARAYGIAGRVETCSQGFPIVLADAAPLVHRSVP